jgi:hypothetical protein
MNTATRILVCGLAAGTLAMASGCATASRQQPPLSYVAVERPTGPIRAGGQKVEAKHSRGGPYFLNFGFRPAPDVAAYLKQAQAAAGSDVLKNADVQLHVPFAIDILMFGFQVGSDTVKANQ